MTPNFMRCVFGEALSPILAGRCESYLSGADSSNRDDFCGLLCGADFQSAADLQSALPTGSQPVRSWTRVLARTNRPTTFVCGCAALWGRFSICGGFAIRPAHR